MKPSTLAGNVAVAHKFTYKRMIPSVPQFLFRRTEQIYSAVADVRYIPYIIGKEYSRECSAHIFEFGLFSQHSIQFGLYGFQFFLNCRLVKFWNAHCKHPQDTFNNKLAGNFSRNMTTNAIAYSNHIAVVAKIILVVATLSYL